MTDPARPQPVMNWSKATSLTTGLVATIGAILVAAGYLDPTQVSQLQQAVTAIVAAISAVVAVVVPLIHGKQAAAQVTPTIDPVSHSGQPLLTEAQWQAEQYGRHAAMGVDFDTLRTAAMEARDANADLQQATDNLGGMAHGEIPLTVFDRGTSPYVRLDQTREMPVTELRPLGRVVRHDPRSLQYLVPESTATPTSIAWARKIPVLDQGNLGSCTGNATVGVLGSEPFYDTLTPTEQGTLDENEAVKVYSLATQLDGFGGTYPPDDTGSSGLGAAQAAKQLGLISGYQHITSLAAAQTAIQQGPFIVGTDWYSGMDNPDANGLVQVTGTVRGGHEYECYGYNADADTWHFWNSWGPGWGLNGAFSYSSADFAKLLASQGDATTFVPLTQPAPAPTPTPTPVPVDPTPTPPAPVPTPTPVPPTPIPVGFPLKEWDAFAAHHRSEIKWQKLKAAVDAWLSGGGV